MSASANAKIAVAIEGAEQVKPEPAEFGPKAMTEDVAGERPDPLDLLLTSTQLRELDIPERECFIKPWMMRGSITLIFAPTKVGKTWFSLSIAAALARGAGMLGWEVPCPKSVLYVDGEMSLAELKGRIGMLINDDGPVHLLASERVAQAVGGPLDISCERDQRWLEKAIEACKAEVLILDNLSSLVRDMDENDNSSPALETIIRWLVRLRHMGRAVILVHHAGHNERRPRGASRLMGVVDSVVRLARESAQDQGQFTISFEHLRGEKPNPDRLSVELRKGDDGMMRLVEMGATGPNREMELLNAIAGGKFKTQKALATELGLSEASVSGIAKKLRAAQLLGKGLTLTALGKQQIEASGKSLQFTGSN